MSASFRSKVAQLTRSDPASHPESSLLDQPLALKKELLNLCMDWGHDHHWSTRAPCKCYCTQTHSNLAEGKEWSRSMPLNKQPRQSMGLYSIRESQFCSSPLPLSAIPCCSLSALHLSAFLTERCFLGGTCALFSFLKANTNVTTRWQHQHWVCSPHTPPICQISGYCSIASSTKALQQNPLGDYSY